MNGDGTGCAHEFGDWRPHASTTDVLERRCLHCRVWEYRVLPPVRTMPPREERGWWNWEETG